MQIIDYDPLLENIYKIEKIESISITDITQTIGGKIHIIPTMIVSYNGSNTLCLCSTDKYFDEFVKKVTEVYHDEKDNIYEDSLTDPFGLRKQIKVNDRTRQILESRELLDVREMYKHYESLDSYEESLLFQSDEVKNLIQIIEYHIIRFFEFTDTSIKLDSTVTGYKNRYVMNGSINGLEKYFPFSYKRISDNHYLITIAGILENDVLKMKIDYKSNGIDVTLYSEKNGLYCEYSYNILNGVVRRKEDFTLRGLTTHYINEDLEKSDNIYSNISSFDYDKSFNYFKLPWGAIYGIKTNIEEISNEECRTEIIGSIIDVNDSTFTRRDSYYLEYKRKDTPTRVGEKIVLEDFESIITGIELDNNPNHYVIETKFLDARSTSGYYVTHLNGKYFYHLAYLENGLKSKIPNDTPIKHDDINKKSDFENISLVKHLLGGK